MEFTLEKWHMKFKESLYKHANNPRVAENLRNHFPCPYALEDAERYILSCEEKEGLTQIVRAIVVNGQAVGSIGVLFKDDVYIKTAELGFWLAEPFWHQGIITTAIKPICDLAFASRDLVRIYAESFAQNIGSRKALQKAGFELEGILKKNVFKNGKITDSCIYALVK